MSWIFLQHLRNEIFSNIRNSDMVRKRIVTLFDLAVSSFNIICFKGRASK